jgi:hypothetical protein
LGEGDLILYDRGYPSFDLFKNDLDKRCRFCCRVAVSNWSVAKSLAESGGKEIIAEIRPGYELRKKYKEQGIDYEPIKCRFICIELSTGEQEVLITSLLDAQQYPYELFEELYHLRWGVEESYYVKQKIMQSDLQKPSLECTKTDSLYINTLHKNYCFV